MEYSIGSLSDLITGSKTPNKKKVVKKQFTPKEHIESTVPQDKVENVQKVEENATKKRKRVKKTIVDNSIGEENVQKKNKKRNLSVSEENEPPIKKSKKSLNAERRIKEKEKIKQEEDPESLSRTVFVGNVPVTSSTKKLKKFFTKYGKVETVRVRGIPVADPKIPKKVAMIKKEFHPERKSFYAFIRFESRDDAIKATEANGILYLDHHLRVHSCDNEQKPDENKAIFVGNLSFYAEEDDLWKIFESCGSILSVRIVRDGKTGIGKGFGYVNFENSDSVTLALEMENVKLKERELRISACNLNAAKKNKKGGKMKKVKAHKVRAGKPIKSEKNSEKNQDPTAPNEVPAKKEGFEGVKLLQKKKKKFNKGLQQKKKLVKQIAPK